MNLDRRHWLALAAALSSGAFVRHAAAQGAARSDPWPAKPLRIVAGGAASVTDLRARWLAPRLSQALGQTVLVDNVPAAGGNVAAAEVVRSAPDGTTMLVHHQGIAAINPHLYAKPGYDPLTDLAPVTRFGHGSLLLAVPAAVPAQSVAELVALARAQPDKANYGSPGNGTPPHLAGALFAHMAGLNATHVPYRGGGALMTALLGGQLMWSVEGLTAQLPHVRSGALRALAVTGPRRSPALPEVPTMAEAGVKGYAYEGWTGFAVTAATPRPIVQRLHDEIARIAASDDAKAWFAASGAEAGILAPDEFTALIRAEHERWGGLIRTLAIRAE